MISIVNVSYQINYMFDIEYNTFFKSFLKNSRLKADQLENNQSNNGGSKPHKIGFLDDKMGRENYLIEISELENPTEQICISKSLQNQF